MGFTASFRTFAVRILSCCDEEPATPRRALVIGAPYDFTHVSGPSIVSSAPTSPSSSLHSSSLKDLAEKSSFANLTPAISKPSPIATYSADTGIEAFLANRRLGGSTASNSTTASSVQAHVRQLSKSLRQCSACSAGEGMGGLELDGAGQEGGVVVHVEEVDSTIDTGSLRPEDFTDNEDEVGDEDDDEEAVVHDGVVAPAPLKSRKSTRSIRKMSIAASLRTNGLRDEDDDDDEDDVEEDDEEDHEVVLVEEIAKAVSMKRYGSTDLLTDVTPEKKKR